MVSPVVIITGSSSGIGKAICHEFHSQGCRVVATARQLGAIADLKAIGMLTLALDATDSTAVKQVVKTVLTSEGRIDILVNNAGFGQFSPLMDISQPQLQAQFQTNVLAPLDLVQQAASAMKRQRSGTIINMGSISGVVTTPFAGAYCTSKAALHSLSDALGMELAPFGIRVVTVQPGAIQSNFGEVATQSLAGVVSQQSWYKSLEPMIRARANLSQGGATPVDRFAEQMVAAVMKAHPSPVVRLGKKSWWLPLLKQLLPARLLDVWLKRRFDPICRVLPPGQPPRRSTTPLCLRD